ncbi:MAG: glycosyltransferase family 2 protein [Prevotella sp.]|nr:glycosyltransferase family 2 protein [Prevotella sp.]
MLVSILVPVYNAGEYLRQCLTSLTGQSHRDIELVLVDDGSTDGSGQVCDDLAASDSRVKVIHKENAGVAEARITAFEHCTGDYVTFVDADDYVANTLVESMLNMAIEFDADIVACGHFNVMQQGQKKERHTMRGLYNKDAIRKAISECLLYDKNTRANGMAIYLWGKLMRRSLVGEALLQGRGLWFAEDQIALFHMLYHAQRLYVMHEPLYYYVQHPQQVSKRYDSSIWEMQAECWRRYRKVDSDNLLGEQLDMRIWKSIYLTIKQRIAPNVNSAKAFGVELEKARKTDEIARFFKKRRLNESLKENLKFWMLKYRLYTLYYKTVVS